MTQLVEVTHNITLALIKEQVDLICIDFLKAFDPVPHRKLVEKMTALGLNSTIIIWIGAYLTNRSRVVEVSGSISSS